MARRSTLPRPPRAGSLARAAALIFALSASAHAQSGPATPPSAAPATAEQETSGTAYSKSCQPGARALAEDSALPNVAAALSKSKTLRILAMGAAPGRVGGRTGSYTGIIETMLERALKGTDVVIINRGVSGELAAGAAIRMRNEVALENPDLVLWQVGTNDALAYVPVEEFAAVVSDQIAWLKRHNVDVVLVGLQFAPRMTRDEHYVQIRETLRKIAANENVPVVRFYEAMQIVSGASEQTLPVAEEFEHNEEGYNCLAQYVARAITLGVFAKNLRPPKAQQAPAPPAPAPATPKQ
jgi:lysophospholipase L1-like esterase